MALVNAPLALTLLLGTVACTTAAGTRGTATTSGGAQADPPAQAADDALHVSRRIDGDSFVASDGVEYRVGLIDTPEIGTCGAEQASARVEELLAAGFEAETYAEDVHGRQVARIRTDEGDLGVILAAEGLADDRYLEQFRHENPAYAAELADAFADARAGRAGLWQTCWADDAAGTTSGDTARGPAAAPHGGRTGGWTCHPAYVECLPDGRDLDCRDVGHQVVLTGRDDPFRLDGNSTTATDGVGCDTFEPWSAEATYGYYPTG